MSLFVSTTYYRDNVPVSEVLNQLKTNDINNVEIGSNHCWEPNYDYLNRYKFNFLIHNYFPVPKKNIVINIASCNKNIRSESINHIKHSIEFASRIGAKLYTFHPGFVDDPISQNISASNYDFIWQKNKSVNNNISNIYQKMYESIKIICDFASKIGLKIAIETQGSYYQNDYLLMTKTQEYEDFINHFSQNEIGINVNIGHLNLSAKKNNFKISNFISKIDSHIVAFELSHNNGKKDEHVPMQENAWYWKILALKKFSKIPKILEFRNVSIYKLLENIKLCKNKLNVL